VHKVAAGKAGARALAMHGACFAMHGAFFDTRMCMDMNMVAAMTLRRSDLSTCDLTTTVLSSTGPALRPRRHGVQKTRKYPMLTSMSKATPATSRIRASPNCSLKSPLQISELQDREKIAKQLAALVLKHIERIQASGYAGRCH
jgi:hypothetical protein